MAEAPLEQFVEDLALSLTSLGLARMPSRVFSVLLSCPEDGLTARELADRLSVSPAAISGAVRYLTGVHMATKTRRPGERVDRYRLQHHLWESAITAEMRGYGPLIALCTRALEEVDLDDDARRRVAETRDFLSFVAEEMPLMVERWRRRRDRA